MLMALLILLWERETLPAVEDMVGKLCSVNSDVRVQLGFRVNKQSRRRRQGIWAFPGGIALDARSCSEGPALNPGRLPAGTQMMLVVDAAARS